MLADLKYRLRALFQRAAMDQELAAELEYHIERETEKLMRAGYPPAEAARRARLEFGGVEQIKEDTRGVRGIALFDRMSQDTRHAWRTLRANPGYAIALIITLGLGIGANTVMFGVTDRLLFRPPAFLASDERIHRVHFDYLWNGELRQGIWLEYKRYLDFSKTTSFDLTAAYASREEAVGDGADATELPVMAVSASFFELFTAQPVLGRFFNAAEDKFPAGERVAVIGWGLWQTRYAGARDVLGQSLRIGSRAYTIVGVAPRDFNGLNVRLSAAAFVPITAYAYARQTDYANGYNWSWLEMLVRRQPEVSEAAANADLQRAAMASWESESALAARAYPAAAESKVAGYLGPILIERGPLAGPESKVVLWVMGVAVIVLLIACANVANLMLARALHRQREIAVRLALGVSRGRLLQLLITEALLIALLGGLAGLLLAKWLGGALRTLFLGSQQQQAVVSDDRTLLFTAVITLAVALLTGLTPALQSMRTNLSDSLKSGLRSIGGHSSPLRVALLLVQGALSVVLLIGAALFVRSLQNVRSIPMGYDVDPIVFVAGNPRGEELTPERSAELSYRLLEVARAIPGVTNATLTVSVPFWGSEGRGAPRGPGLPDSVAKMGRYTLQAGSPSFFQTFGTRILRGRGITEHDQANSQPVVVVSAAMAGALWPGQDAIGKQFKVSSDTLPFLTVVGIAENIRTRDLARDNEFWYYLPISQYGRWFGVIAPGLFVRVDGAAAEFVEPLRQRLQREMPGASYIAAAPLRSLVEPQHRAWQFGATTFTAFAIMALILAAVGLYSVVAYAVTNRTRELGLRIALGASTSAVIRPVVNQGVLFATAGIALGGGVVLLAGRWLEPLLFAQTTRDPVVFGGVAALLLLITVVATLKPALQATRVDPTVALRAE